MIVVSDTSAITNLIQIKLLLIIKQLYGEIILPRAVYQELTYQPAQKKIIDSQEWIKIKEISNKDFYKT